VDDITGDEPHLRDQPETSHWSLKWGSSPPVNSVDHEAGVEW